MESWGDRPCVEYLAGRIDEDELWKRTGYRGFYGRLAAHFTMGMKNLAAGDRSEAKRHFEECTALNGNGIFDVAWANAYLKRMEDPNWPSWIRDNVSKYPPEPVKSLSRH